MKKSEIVLELSRLNGKIAFLENRIRELEHPSKPFGPVLPPPISPPPLWPGVGGPQSGVLLCGSGKVTSA